MPCNSDYMAPNYKERELQETAQCLAYVYEARGETPPAVVASAANNIYCTQDFVPELCAILRVMEPDEQERIIYNARDPKSRKLADWWDKHKVADLKRLFTGKP